jgi:phosphoenolpyruvate carboxykinase (ATP)
MLGKKIDENNVKVWLVNTGWSGGVYGVGSRIRLKYTRAMITAALEGQLEGVDYREHEVFGLQMPEECPGVPTDILDPRSTWRDKETYDKKAVELAEKFNKNFDKFKSGANDETLNAAPKVTVNL